ncbi:hypothetical protein HNP29_000478 [Pseudomonas alcaligenes]|nr:hypothetical protein [Pseudomonas alcaligenes]
MRGRFERAQARLHRVGSRRLADAIGRYVPVEGVPVDCIPLQVQREVELAGPNDMIIGVPIALTFAKLSLRSAERGDVFEVEQGCSMQRLIVDDTVLDDGHMITVSCTEAL